MARKTLKDNIKAVTYIHDFLHEYAEKHLTNSRHTLKSYEMTIKNYLDYLEKEKKISPRDFTVKCFDKKTILDWLDWLQNKKNRTPQTCNIRLSNLRTFLKYVKDQDPGAAKFYIDSLDIKLRPVVKTKIHALSKDAVKSLFTLPDTDTSLGRRDLVFMYLTYVAALRMSEALQLKIKDLHLDEARPYIEILGKGYKRRTMYLVSSCVKQLKGYIKEFHGDTPNPEAYLFYSRIRSSQDHLSPEAVKKLLYKYGKKGHSINKGIPEKLHCHQLRHSRATHWLEEGINLMQISFLLGHAQLSTTAVYLDLSKEEAMKAMRIFEDFEDKDYINNADENENSLLGFAGFNQKGQVSLGNMEDL